MSPCVRPVSKCRPMAALAVALLHCGPRDTLNLAHDLPEDTRWVVVVELRPDGAVEVSPPTRALDPLHWTPHVDSRVFVLAYDADALMNAGGTDEAIRGSPWFLASECDPTLPAPRVRRELVAGALVETDEPLPALTTEWLQSPTYLVDARCVRYPCGTAFESTGRCTFRLTHGSCLAPIVDGTYGGGRVPTLDGEGCSTTTPPPDAVSAAVCRDVLGTGACNLTLYEASTPDWTVESTAIFDVPYRAVAGDTLRISYGRGGYLVDVLPLDDEIIVVSRAGAFTRRVEEADCTTQIHTLDADLREVSTATAACIRAIAPDQDPGTFLAALDDRVVRFDRTGVPLLSSPTLVVDGTDATTHAIDLVLDAVNDTVVVALEADEEEGLAAVVTLDLDDLRPVGEVYAFVAQVSSIAMGEPGYLLMADSASNAVLTLELASGARSSAPVPHSRSIHTAAVGYDPLHHTTIALVSDEERFVQFQEASERSQRAPYEIDVGPMALAPFRGAFLVAGTTEPGDAAESYLLRLDVENRRFLPGVTRVGRGPVARLKRARDGSVVGMLSWEASIFRVRP